MINDPPCTKCENGRGAFPDCVSLEGEADGACNNHVWGKEPSRCSLNERTGASHKSRKRGARNGTSKVADGSMKRPKRENRNERHYGEVDPRLQDFLDASEKENGVDIAGRAPHRVQSTPVTAISTKERLRLA